jgi:hypothetical protein
MSVFEARHSILFVHGKQYGILVAFKVHFVDFIIKSKLG